MISRIPWVGRSATRDLLFTAAAVPCRPSVGEPPDPGNLGAREPNAAGRRYRHGTLTGYSMAGAGVVTARALTPAPGRCAARPVRISRGRGACWTPKGISPRDRFRKQVWDRRFRPRDRPSCAGAGSAARTHMRTGCRPGERTCGPSGSDSGTPCRGPPNAICTLPDATTPRRPPSHGPGLGTHRLTRGQALTIPHPAEPAPGGWRVERSILGTHRAPTVLPARSSSSAGRGTWSLSETPHDWRQAAAVDRSGNRCPPRRGIPDRDRADRAGGVRTPVRSR
jgi:hypothetical protein